MYKIILSDCSLATFTHIEITDRGFKALKQATKLLYLVLRRPIEALETYTGLLKYTRSAVTRNYSEKTINNILDYVGGGKWGSVDVDVLEKFYQATKSALQEAKNEVCFVRQQHHQYIFNQILLSTLAAFGENELETREVMA